MSPRSTINAWNSLGKCLLFLLASGSVFPRVDALSNRSPPATTKQQQRQKEAYAAARASRIALGHNNVSRKAYLELLERYPDDCTTASHLAATSWTPRYQRQVCCFNGNDESAVVENYRKFQHCLIRANYSNQQVNSVLGIKSQSSHSLCPIFITPAAAGTLSRKQVDERLTQTAVECMIALFLVGAAVQKPRLTKLLGKEFLDLADSLSLLYPSEADPDRLLATVQIFPLQFEWNVTLQEKDPCSSTLYIMTDWHPRVLSQIQVGESEQAVMYIGPDSIGLVHHFGCHHYTTLQQQHRPTRIMDLCTGSGIQALYGLARNKHSRATCVDISERALRFVLANALLNDMNPERLQLIKGDLLSGKGRQCHVKEDATKVHFVPGEDDSIMELLLDASSPERFDIITANPPFLPVPPALASYRYGKFSDGGGSGEDVIQAIVRIARRVLGPTAVLAVVSEFFLAPRDDNSRDQGTPLAWTADALLKRINLWWNDGENSSSLQIGQKTKAEPCGFLVTNDFPIDRHTYAMRRADSMEEYNVWVDHLKAIDMEAASPGFLYLKNGCQTRGIGNRVAPWSPFGSLWTPSNPDAVAFTGRVLRDLYKR